MKVKLISTNKFQFLEYWAIEVLENGEVIDEYNIELDVMKNLEVAAKLSEGRQMIKWLNSEIGQLWLIERMKTPSRSPLGSFL